MVWSTGLLTCGLSARPSEDCPAPAAWGQTAGAASASCTSYNYAPIAIAVHKTAQAVIQKGVVTEGVLNRVEMAVLS